MTPLEMWVLAFLVLLIVGGSFLLYKQPPPHLPGDWEGVRDPITGRRK